MAKNTGDWVVVMKTPDMRSRKVGRYVSRSEAEHTKERLMRLTGNRTPYVVMFDPPVQQTFEIPFYP
jgi:hypothetical protein